MNTVPNVGPERRSTHAPNIRPVATETNLSQGSAWIPRVVPADVVERDVVLYRPEVRHSGGHHLLALPVLLEPPAVVAVDGQLPHHQPRNRRCLACNVLP